MMLFLKANEILIGKEVKLYLKGYMGDFYQIQENAEKIYIGNELPEEYTESESRKALKGASAKAKANAATAIPELIQIASNPEYQENNKEKHNKDAKNGWYLVGIEDALLGVATLFVLHAPLVEALTELGSYLAHICKEGIEALLFGEDC